MNVIVLGCGRVGAELAYRLFRRGHQVAVVDPDPAALRTLPADFRGRMIQGEVLDQDVLRRAGIEHADAVAAVTPSDAVNAVVAHVARVVFHVPAIVARNYEPGKRALYEAFGLQVVSPSSWGAQRIEEMLSPAALHTVFSAGNGEVELYELLVPEAWAGRSLDDLVAGCQCRIMALTRAGRARLPEPGDRLEAGDVIHVGATREGIEELRRQLEALEEA
jgi:trk system potassium uptake protein TrkA